MEELVVFKGVMNFQKYHREIREFLFITTIRHQQPQQQVIYL